MNTPTIYTPYVIQTLPPVSKQIEDGRWVACRPSGWPGLCLMKRVRCAWLVFTGRADVLRWEGQQ